MKKVLKISGIVIAVPILLLLVTPYLLPDTIAKETKQWINQHIKGAAPFGQDTLLYNKTLSFRVDLSAVFSNQVKLLSRPFLI